MAEERGRDMSTLVGLEESRSAWERPLAKPLDEALWQAWVAKGRAQDRRRSAARVKAMQWISIAGLLAAAGLWSHLTPYEVVVRFIVAAGAMVVTFQAFNARRYAVVAVFGALALLYNPVAPVFSFSGDWPRVAVLASAAPFVVLLAWRNERPAHND
jgi:uncharacterized membrane protein YoaK (UPF0700 family)